MYKNEKKIFNGKLYKSNKSISTTIGKDSIEESNNTKTIISHHRKNISSFFIGSYITDNELNKLLKENNDKTTYENRKITDFSYENETNSLSKNINIYDIKNSLLKEKENNMNSSITNLNTNGDEKCIPFSNSSFYSYTNENEENKDEINQNIIIKTNKGLNNEIIIKPNEMNFINIPKKEIGNNINNGNDNMNKEKSFLPIRNTLKFIKDKDERLTESYLMALSGGNFGSIDEKNQYLPTVSVIEEEKSEFFETTNKKKSIKNNSLLLLDKEFKKRKIENEFQSNNNYFIKEKNFNNKENISNNDNTNLVDDKLKKINLDLNKIIIKNSYREEKKEICLKKNKINKNSGYFNKKNSITTLNSKNKNKKTNLISKISNNSKNKKIINTSRKNSISSNQVISVKKRRTLSYCEKNQPKLVPLKRFNTQNKFKKKKKKEKYSISNLIKKKININNNMCKKSSDNIKEKKVKNILNKSLNNILNSRIKINIKVPRIKFLDNKKNDIIFTKKSENNLSINNFNKQNKEKILLNPNHKKSISLLNQSTNNYKHKNTFSEINNNIAKKINSTQFKQKVRKIIKNDNKIYKNITKSKSKDKILTSNSSNINQIFNFIKENIKFSKENEKIEVLKIFEKYNNINKDKFIIFCENKINKNPFFNFKALYKYFDKEKKYIKILGNEKYPNNILTKTINNNDYIIYESRIVYKEKIPIIILNKINISNITCNCKVLYEKFK